VSSDISVAVNYGHKDKEDLGNLKPQLPLVVESKYSCREPVQSYWSFFGEVIGKEIDVWLTDNAL
jgi:hypothetical protein